MWIYIFFAQDKSIHTVGCLRIFCISVNFHLFCSGQKYSYSGMLAYILCKYEFCGTLVLRKQICYINCNIHKSLKEKSEHRSLDPSGSSGLFGIKYSSEWYNWWITWERERLWWHHSAFKNSRSNHPGWNCTVSTY